MIATHSSSMRCSNAPPGVPGRDVRTRRMFRTVPPARDREVRDTLWCRWSCSRVGWKWLCCNHPGTRNYPSSSSVRTTGQSTKRYWGGGDKMSKQMTKLVLTRFTLKSFTMGRSLGHWPGRKTVHCTRAKDTKTTPRRVGWISETLIVERMFYGHTRSRR